MHARRPIKNREPMATPTGQTKADLARKKEGISTMDTANQCSASRKTRRKPTQFVPALLGFYLLMSACVFDYRGASFPPDEDNDSFGNPVAVGPRLRPWLNQKGETSFEGDEWPFQVFHPISLLWLKIHGYVRPIEYR
jgi:hypothetical protein